mmetsp:Transcript_46460/g.140732  ORF Transcript_46460/g.140732 Transcript_46460/m.140732 type:complete len:167 (-) Transcript_46460:293-793(-)
MLTRLLLPSTNQGGRVVTVSSEAHRYAVPTVDWGSGNYPFPYSQSKLCNLLFASALQDRLNGEGRRDVRSVALHPGTISTRLFDDSTPIWGLVRLRSNKTAEQGAATSVYCALAADAAGGGYYRDCRRAVPSRLARDAGGRFRDDLWDKTERVISENGFRLPRRLI